MNDVGTSGPDLNRICALMLSGLRGRRVSLYETMLSLDMGHPRNNIIVTSINYDFKFRYLEINDERFLNRTRASSLKFSKHCPDHCSYEVNYHGREPFVIFLSIGASK